VRFGIFGGGKPWGDSVERTAQSGAWVGGIWENGRRQF